MTPYDALRDMLDMGVDPERIRRIPFDQWPALHATIIQECIDFQPDN